MSTDIEMIRFLKIGGKMFLVVKEKSQLNEEGRERKKKTGEMNENINEKYPELDRNRKMFKIYWKK